MQNNVDHIIPALKHFVCQDGWVPFGNLESGLRRKFEEYCQEQGCTLTTDANGESKAPWSDFENFLRGKNADD